MESGQEVDTGIEEMKNNCEVVFRRTEELFTHGI